MKATLYKLKEGWVLCSDERLTESSGLCIGDLYWKLGIDTGDVKDSLVVLTQSPILSSLSPDKQKEIGWFEENLFNELLSYVPYSLKDSYKQKVSELTSDRRFTEDDMISFGKQCFYKGFNKCKNDDANSFTSWREEGGILIKNIQQPKSWEVEIECEYWKDSSTYDQPDTLLDNPVPKIVDGKIKVLKILKQL